MTTPHTDTTNSDVHSPETGESRARTWLKPDQVEQLRDECLTDTCPTYLQGRDEAIITLAYDAGLRAGELAGLNVEHLNPDSGTVYLPRAIQKGNSPPVTLGLDRDTVRTLRRYLRDRWKDTTALFPTRSSDRITTRSLRRLVKKLAVGAAIEPHVAGGGTAGPHDVTPHTLRLCRLPDYPGRRWPARRRAAATASRKPGNYRPHL